MEGASFSAQDPFFLERQETELNSHAEGNDRLMNQVSPSRKGMKRLLV